jgi:DNA-binding transcriptional MocR family regulator
MNEGLTAQKAVPAKAAGQQAFIADFNRSIPPVVSNFEGRLSQTLAAISKDSRALKALVKGNAGGRWEDRCAAAAWMSPRFGYTLSPDQTIITNGTQGAILLLLEHFVGQGGLLLTENLTYTPLSTLARRAHIRIRGLALDREGIVPDAFIEACRSDAPRALYCNPSIHNPTTATMSEERRLAIADIARRYGVVVIEDDPLGLLHPEMPRPIAALAPDVCWFVMGVTKCLAHGFRIAAIVGPTSTALNALLEPVRSLSHWFPAPLPAAVFTSWIGSGTADEIREAIRSELAIRSDIAVDCLKGLDVASPPGAMHLWLALPDGVERLELVSRLANEGVSIRSSDVFAVDRMTPANAVRISLGSPQTLDVVREGVARIATTVRQMCR